MNSSSARSRWVVIAIATVLALVGAACGGSGDSATDDTSSATIQTDLIREAPSPPQPGGTLKFALDAETSTGWDPANSQWAGAGTIVSRAVFDRIAELDADGRPQPNLAESLEPNEDFTVWTITLRDGIQFHNGEAFDAAAVKQNLDRLKTSVLLGAVVGVYLDTVEVVDERTVQVTAKRPWATFPSSMATQAGTMAAPEQITSSAPAQNPIGTGPFTFESWAPDSKLVVAKNPSYWQRDADGNPLPYLDEVEFTVLPDQTARGAALDSGSVDAITTFEPDLINRFLPDAEAGEVQMLSNANAEDQSQFVGLNTAKPPFDDLLARQIVVTGLDTEMISETQYFGLFPPSRGFFPSSSPYYAETAYPSYDIGKATALHDEYKAKHGEPLSFSLTLPSSPQFQRIGEAAQAQAQAFGVTIDLNLVDQATLIVDALTGNYEATGFITFGEPPIDQIFVATTTLQPIGQLSLNFTRYADPAIQEAIDAIQRTDIESEHIEQWKIIQDRMAENLSMMFVVRNRTAVVYANDVYGMDTATVATGAPVKPTPSPFTAWVWKQA